MPLGQFGDPGDLGQSGKKVDVGGNPFHGLAGCKFARPTNEERYPNSAFVGRALGTLHPGIESQHGLAVLGGSQLGSFSYHSSNRTIVGHKDQNGVLTQFPFIELVHKPSHVLVDVLYHSIKASISFGKTKVLEPLGVFRRSDEGTVRCIGRNIGKERFSFILHLFDPPHPRRKKQISAIALGFYEGTVVPNSRVEILVSGRIGARAFVGLPNASGPVNESLVKTALMGLVGLLVSQVPLPENPRNVTRFGQHLR